MTVIVPTVHRVVPRLVDEAKRKALISRKRIMRDKWTKNPVFLANMRRAIAENKAAGLNVKKWYDAHPLSRVLDKNEFRRAKNVGRSKAVRQVSLPKLKCLED